MTIATGDAGSRRYRAFVSYSWADEKAGEKLFRWIDGYRPPKALRGRETPLGPVPDRLYPCFRDREELRTAPDVRAALDEALQASDNLIVLCSPFAARSEWVAHEIETFRRLGRADRIHCVLIEGEPAEALPPVLVSQTDAPLAADLRHSGDGWTNGALKLVAGLLGLPFGELKDRELARARARTRLTATIAAGFALLFLGACGATWVALDRSEKMQDALIAILTRSSARVDRVLTEMEHGRARSDDVAREIEEAKGLTDLAFAMAPDNPRLLAAQAQLLLGYNRHYKVIGRSSEALAAATKAASIARRLGSRDNAGIDTIGLQVMALADLADTLVNVGDRAAARERYEEALTVADKAVPLKDDDTAIQLSRSVILSALGRLAQDAGDYSEAETRYEADLGVLQYLLARHPDDNAIQRSQAVSFTRVGDLAVAVGDYVQAKRYYQDAIAIFEKLAARQPDNLDAQHDLSALLVKTGAIELFNGDRKNARAHFEAAASIGEKLVALDPANVGYQHDLASGLGTIGDVAGQTGDLETAKARYEASRAIFEKLAAQDPDNAAAQLDLVTVYVGLAEATGDKAWWLKALPIVERLSAEGKLRAGDAGLLERVRQNAQ